MRSNNFHDKIQFVSRDSFFWDQFSIDYPDIYNQMKSQWENDMDACQFFDAMDRHHIVDADMECVNMTREQGAEYDIFLWRMTYFF